MQTDGKDPEGKALTLQVSAQTRSRLECIQDVTGIGNLKTAAELLIRATWRDYVTKYAEAYGIPLEQYDWYTGDGTRPNTTESFNPDPVMEIKDGQGPTEGYKDLIEFSY